MISIEELIKKSRHATQRKLEREFWEKAFFLSWHPLGGDLDRASEDADAVLAEWNKRWKEEEG